MKVITYQEAKRSADEWLAAHADDRGKMADHSSCARCGQNMQHLNGEPIPHNLPHSSMRCVPMPPTPAATVHSGRCNHRWPRTLAKTYHGCILAEPLEHDTHRCRCGATAPAQTAAP
jgi:hypothetical protein